MRTAAARKRLQNQDVTKLRRPATIGLTKNIAGQEKAVASTAAANKVPFSTIAAQSGTYDVHSDILRSRQSRYWK